MAAERTAPPIDESFALHAREILGTIPKIVYVGSHEVNCENPSAFATPDVLHSSAWVQLTHSYRATNHIVGIKRGEGEDFGMDYYEYSRFFGNLVMGIEEAAGKEATTDAPLFLNGEGHAMDCTSVGRLYFADQVGLQVHLVKLNDLGRALGLEEPTDPEHIGPVEHLTIVSLYPSPDYAAYILEEAKRAQKDFRKMNDEERRSVAHMQTCIPYSECQLPTNL